MRPIICKYIIHLSETKINPLRTIFQTNVRGIHNFAKNTLAFLGYYGMMYLVEDGDYAHFSPTLSIFRGNPTTLFIRRYPA